MGCLHLSGIGYVSPAVYPIQEQMKPGEFWCRNCDTVVPDPMLEEERRIQREESCLRGPNGCEGPIGARESFAGTGTVIYECTRHMDESYTKDAELKARYPEHQPPDFDPAYAGESWYGD